MVVIPNMEREVKKLTRAALGTVAALAILAGPTAANATGPVYGGPHGGINYSGETWVPLASLWGVHANER